MSSGGDLDTVKSTAIEYVLIFYGGQTYVFIAGVLFLDFSLRKNLLLDCSSFEQNEFLFCKICDVF